MDIHHDSPKRLRSNDQKAPLVERNCPTSNVEYGDSNEAYESNIVDMHGQSRLRGKSYKSLELRCHLHNSGSFVTSSPFVENGKNFLLGSGSSSAGTSRAEDSLYDSYAHSLQEMEGIGFSPMLPGPIRRSAVQKNSKSGNCESTESFVSSISATSSPSSYFKDEHNDGVYAHELSREEDEEPESHQKSSDEEDGEWRPGNARVSPLGPFGQGVRTKTAIQLFQDSRPNSPDSLDGNNTLMFGEREEANDERLFMHFSSGPSAERNACRSSRNKTETGTPRTSPSRRGRGCPVSVGGVDPNITRLESSVSVDYISDTEDDVVSHPSSCERPGKRSHNSSARSLPIRPAERCESPDDFLSNSTPGRLIHYSSRPGVRLSGGDSSGRDSGGGGLFGLASIAGSAGEISPVSMNISFDSRDCEGEVEENYCSSAISSPRVSAADGHSVFSDLLRAATEDRLQSDDESQVSSRSHHSRGHRPSQLQPPLKGWASCGNSPVKSLPATSFPWTRQEEPTSKSGDYWESRRGIACDPNKPFVGRSPALQRSTPLRVSNAYYSDANNVQKQSISSSSFNRSSASALSHSAELRQVHVPLPQSTSKRRPNSACSHHSKSVSAPSAALSTHRNRSSSFDNSASAVSRDNEEETCQHPAHGLSLSVGSEGESMPWTGGGKRSRSPRCVSPRYGSHVSVEKSEEEDEEEAVDVHNSSTASSVDSSGNRRPLPDQSAFDSTHLNTTHHSTAAHPSPVCPPTPDRAPHFLYDSTEALAEEGEVVRRGDIFDSNGDLGVAPAIHRVNSLIETKVLASSMDAPEEQEDESTSSGHHRGRHGTTEEVAFYRDFVNEGLMGSGTFAEVFRVSLRADRSQKFAIKKSRRKFRSRKDRETLLNEVRIMQIVGALPCKHIIQFFRAWQEDSFFYVQIELAERGTLKDLMMVYANQHKRIDDHTMLRIVHGVSAGLQHIHNCHVVHLDIKPPNVLISLDGTLKIGDFGIAMLAGGGADEAHEGDSRYLPEELLNSSERHSSADIFSLGLTLYELCQVPELDVLPYGGSLWHDLREGKSIDFSSPSAGGRHEDLCAIIHACMSPVPANRPSATNILSHAALAGLDDSTTCPALCGASVRAPSPIVFRSVCPLGTSSDSIAGPSLQINTAHTPSGEDDDRNLSTPLMGASFNPLYRMLSPPTEMMGDLQTDFFHDSHSRCGWGDTDEHKEQHYHQDSADMETASDHESTASLTHVNCFTPSSHSNSPTRSLLWGRGNSVVQHTPVSSGATSQQSQTQACPVTTTQGSYRHPSPRTSVKKKGGRPHGPIRKVSK